MTLLNELETKAFRQGYIEGYAGRKIHQADWEPEFLRAYNGGYHEGRADKAANIPAAYTRITPFMR